MFTKRDCVRCFNAPVPLQTAFQTVKCVSFLSVMKIEPKQDGASFDVVVVLDPLSQGTVGFVTLFLKIIVTVPTPLSYKAHLHKVLFQNLHLNKWYRNGVRKAVEIILVDGVTIIKNHCVEFATKTVRVIGFCPLAFLIDIGWFISYFSFLYSCSENCTDTDGKFELSFFFHFQ